MQSIGKIVEKNRAYLDMLEAADKKGKRPTLKRKVRKNFTLDEAIFLQFQKRCRLEHKSMSAEIEAMIQKTLI